MINLLKETIDILHRHGKSEEDVEWVGTLNYKTSWESFKKYADVEYDEGFGATYIPNDLLIVGDDFWLERHDYDGSEWWEFKTMPEEPKESRNYTRFKSYWNPTMDDSYADVEDNEE